MVSHIPGFSQSDLTAWPTKCTDPSAGTEEYKLLGAVVNRGEAMMPCEPTFQKITTLASSGGRKLKGRGCHLLFQAWGCEQEVPWMCDNLRIWL